jgi:hypothetical protein
MLSEEYQYSWVIEGLLLVLEGNTEIQTLAAESLELLTPETLLAEKVSFYNICVNCEVSRICVLSKTRIVSKGSDCDIVLCKYSQFSRRPVLQ